MTETLAIGRCLTGPGSEAWYGDGKPLWREGKDNRPAMTSDEARAQRRRDVKMLRRHGKRRPGALKLADAIEGCAPGTRCTSAACVECRRATQRLFVAAADRILKNSSVTVLAVSVILKGAWVPEGKLLNDPDVFGRLSNRIRRALRAAGIRQAFGGFDISANEHVNGRFIPHFRPHVYVFIPTKQFARGEAIFRSQFARSATVRRPIVAKTFDGKRRGLAYALKINFKRRVTLPRMALPNGEVERRNTRDRPLRAHQKLEIATALDRAGLGARIFLHGLRTVQAGGGLRFVRPPQVSSAASLKRNAHPDNSMSIPKHSLHGATPRSALSPARGPWPRARGRWQ